MEGIVDFHTHAFPDELAGRAMKVLEAEAPIKGFHDGRVGSLLASMERAGIARSVVCSIATKPGQFEAILSWSGKIRSDKIVPFPSVHPDDPQLIDRIVRIHGEGFQGIKLHPYYQEFFLNEERLCPMYEKMSELGLILVMHTGFDIAFPPIRRADPEKVLWVKERFPELKFMATHLGAWKQWDEVERFILGRKIHTEISFALEFLSEDEARRMLISHPAAFLYFGTDSPWTDQAQTLARLRKLNLGENVEQAILRDNACTILGI